MSDTGRDDDGEKLKRNPRLLLDYGHSTPPPRRERWAPETRLLVASIVIGVLGVIGFLAWLAVSMRMPDPR